MAIFNRKNIIRLGLFFLIELQIVWMYFYPVSSLSFPGFPLDDSWIYAVFSRRFAGSGEIAFNSGSPAVGFTSSLWFLILSLGYSLKIPPVIWSLLAGSLFQLITAWYFYRLLKDFLTSRPGYFSAFLADFLSWTGGLLILLCGSLIWYSLSGMETSMFLAWGLLSVYSVSRKRYGAAGLFIGLLLVTRIEGMTLWGLAVLFAIYREVKNKQAGTSEPRKSSSGEIYQEATVGAVSNRDQIVSIGVILRRLFLLCCIPAIFLGLEMLKNMYLTGGILPTTFAGRKWLSVPAGGRGAVAYFKIWFYGLKISLLPSFLQTGPLSAIFWSIMLVLVVLSILIMVRRSFGHGNKISGLFLLLLWALFHNLVYIIILPSPSQAGRYQAVNFILFWLLGYLPLAAGISGLGRGGLKEKRSGREKPGIPRKVVRLCLFLLLGALIILDLFSAFKWRTIYLSSVRHINDVHITAARWIDRFLPPGSRVAAFDIGALKYFSDGTEVIDLGGLVDRDFAAYLEEERVVDYLRKKKAQYLAMVELQTSPGWIFDNLKIKGDPRLELEPLFGVMLRPEIYRIHYREAANTFPKIVVYKIKWNDEISE